MYLNTAYAAHHILCLTDEGPTLKTSDFTFYIGSTATLLYFDLYLNTAYAEPHILSLSDEGPTFETSDFTFYIGSTPTFLYFDLYLNTAYVAHYVFAVIKTVISLAMIGIIF